MIVFLGTATQSWDGKAQLHCRKFRSPNLWLLTELLNQKVRKHFLILILSLGMPTDWIDVRQRTESSAGSSNYFGQSELNSSINPELISVHRTNRNNQKEKVKLCALKRNKARRSALTSPLLPDGPRLSDSLSLQMSRVFALWRLLDLRPSGARPRCRQQSAGSAQDRPKMVWHLRKPVSANMRVNRFCKLL